MLIMEPMHYAKEQERSMKESLLSGIILSISLTMIYSDTKASSICVFLQNVYKKHEAEIKQKLRNI